MNRYGEQARTWWQQLAPTDYAQMQDPDAFFTRLGEQAAAEVADLTELILERDKVSEEDKEKMRFAARLSAEEIVREEMLLPPRYVWDSDPDVEEPMDEEAQQEAYWDEYEEWLESVERDHQAWVREQKTHAELRERGWNDERIRKVGTRIDLSDPDAIALLTKQGLLEPAQTQCGVVVAAKDEQA